MKRVGRVRLRWSGLGVFAVIVVVFISLLGVVVGDWWWLRLALVGTAVLVIDGMVSLRALGRAGLTVAVSGPTDAVVGQRSELAVSVQGLSSPALLSLPGPGVWAHVHDGDSGLLSVVHRRRGLFSHLAVLLIHSAPFGLVGASRTLLVELAAPLHVAPQCQPAPGLRLPTTVYDGLDARPRRGSTPELVRGPRQYQPGDPINRVHWPATARAPGTLMVREMESLISRSVVIVADLGPTISSNTFIGVDGLGNFSAYNTAPYAEVAPTDRGIARCCPPPKGRPCPSFRFPCRPPPWPLLALLMTGR